MVHKVHRVTIVQQCLKLFKFCMINTKTMEFLVLHYCIRILTFLLQLQFEQIKELSTYVNQKEQTNYEIILKVM